MVIRTDGTPMLTVNRAALDRQIIAPQAHQRGFQSRGAIDDHEFGSFQAAGIKVIEELAPRGGALAAHVPDGKQHLLTVAAHTYGSQNRDVRGLLVDAGLDHGAVENDANDVFIGEAAGATRASQSTFTLRQARLTTSLLTAPSNSPNSARLTRRVLVPER